MKLIKEQIDVIKNAKSLEELQSLAKDKKIEISKETLSSLYDAYCVNNTELSEEELDNVTGGTCYSEGIYINGVKHEYVITTLGNGCDAFQREYKGASNCHNCKHVYPEIGYSIFDVIDTFYCKIRWKGHDTVIGPGLVK